MRIRDATHDVSCTFVRDMYGRETTRVASRRGTTLRSEKKTTSAEERVSSRLAPGPGAHEARPRPARATPARRLGVPRRGRARRRRAETPRAAAKPPRRRRRRRRRPARVPGSGSLVPSVRTRIFRVGGDERSRLVQRVSAPPRARGGGVAAAVLAAPALAGRAGTRDTGPPVFSSVRGVVAANIVRVVSLAPLDALIFALRLPRRRAGLPGAVRVELR